MKKLILLTLLLIVWSIALSRADNQIPQPSDLNLVEEPRLLQAIESAQKAVEKAPGKAAAWGQLGKVYHIHGWEVEAAQCYRRAAEIDPTEFRWLYYLGMITHKTDPQEAEVVLLTRKSPPPNNRSLRPHLRLSVSDCGLRF